MLHVVMGHGPGARGGASKRSTGPGARAGPRVPLQPVQHPVLGAQVHAPVRGQGRLLGLLPGFEAAGHLDAPRVPGQAQGQQAPARGGRYYSIVTGGYCGIAHRLLQGQLGQPLTLRRKQVDLAVGGAGEDRAVRPHHGLGGFGRDGVAPQQRALRREAVDPGRPDQDRAVGVRRRAAGPAGQGHLPAALPGRGQGQQAPVRGGQVEGAVRADGRRRGGLRPQLVAPALPAAPVQGEQGVAGRKVDGAVLPQGGGERGPGRGGEAPAGLAARPDRPQAPAGGPGQHGAVVGHHGTGRRTGAQGKPPALVPRGADGVQEAIRGGDVQGAPMVERRPVQQGAAGHEAPGQAQAWASAVRPSRENSRMLRSRGFIADWNRIYPKYLMQGKGSRLRSFRK